MASHELAEIALRERIRSLPLDACPAYIHELIAEARRLPFPPSAMALEALVLKLLEHRNERN